jgi:hypothetical protein
METFCFRKDSYLSTPPTILKFEGSSNIEDYWLKVSIKSVGCPTSPYISSYRKFMELQNKLSRCNRCQD